MVIADPGAGYFGVDVDERTLVTGKDARLGETRFETWLTQSAKADCECEPSVQSECGGRVPLEQKAEYG